jgi:hypothetical protein
MASLGWKGLRANTSFPFMMTVEFLPSSCLYRSLPSAAEGQRLSERQAGNEEQHKVSAVCVMCYQTCQH